MGFPYLTQSVILLVLPFCIGPVWVISAYLTQSGILLVSPFLHRTGMGYFAIFDLSGILLICYFCIRPEWLILPYLMQSGVLSVLPFFHMTGMDDSNILDSICNFVHFVVVGCDVIIGCDVVMSVVMSFMMSSCQLRSCDVTHEGSRDVLCDVIMLVVMF